MKFSLSLSALVALTSAHGLIRSITGANNVVMPGLSVTDGTPRDCSSNGCGSQADTAIIRNREIASGKASPLGRTQGGGPVDPAAAIATFMGNSSTAAGNTSADAASADQIAADSRLDPDRMRRRQQLGATETIVADTAGKGAGSGLPTADDNGVVTMTFYQINADGAGPLRAAIDPTSGGSDASAFETAEVTQDIPGIFSLSRNSQTEFDVQVQMPAGMTCEGTVAGVDNVCIARVQNSALAGPFGGAVAFTQSAAARKRALRVKKRAVLGVGVGLRGSFSG